ncbi:uncharacterized protein [Fopius arisanus]|uniref:Uncharacterized protein n=1 Tax=Fopius arisanus TaxID=64838 RepID=A0A9R1U8W6_9HYME|nr:PREDICTED: uncharacterized protein LOC105272788 [Fopius arisanus]
MIDYTVTNILKKIQLNDNTVEIIGWAESLGPLEQTGLQEFVFQCILKNDENQKIKFIAFNDDARRLYPFFLQDYVMHIDGAVAKLRNDIEGKEEALSFELQAQSNTIDNCLGSQDVVWINA